MDTFVPDGLPSLAKGSRPRGSGQACVMNYLSYLNGDVQVTDLPDCTEPQLAMLAQNVNDDLCWHTGPSDLLCSDCAGELLRLAPLLIGTRISEPGAGVSGPHLTPGALRRTSLVDDRVIDFFESQGVDIRAAAAVYNERLSNTFVHLQVVHELRLRVTPVHPTSNGKPVPGLLSWTKFLAAFRDLLVAYRAHFGLDAVEISPQVHRKVLAEIAGRTA